MLVLCYVVGNPRLMLVPAATLLASLAGAPFTTTTQQTLKRRAVSARLYEHSPAGKSCGHI
jgi:hypothetical protein